MPNIDNLVTKHIKGFRFDNRINNGTHYGFLFKRYIKIPFAHKKYQTRVLRVWVPEGFDINKQYGVLYMSDGQNAVDEALTAYGEWDMEDHFFNLVEEGYPEFIIVGIDCPRNGKQRMLEYLPGDSDTKGKYTKGYYGNKYAEYIAHQIVPFINSRFNVNKDLVGYCGSSMGGLISFYICSKYPHIFKFCISFSPAFFFFSKEKIIDNFARRHFNPDNDPTYAFFIGGADPLERELTPNTDLMVSLLKEAHFDENKLLYLKDVTRIHHESTWSAFIEDALRFCLKNYQK